MAHATKTVVFALNDQRRQIGVEPLTLVWKTPRLVKSNLEQYRNVWRVTIACQSAACDNNGPRRQTSPITALYIHHCAAYTTEQCRDQMETYRNFFNSDSDLHKPSHAGFHLFMRNKVVR